VAKAFSKAGAFSKTNPPCEQTPRRRSLNVGRKQDHKDAHAKRKLVGAIDDRKKLEKRITEKTPRREQFENLIGHEKTSNALVKNRTSDEKDRKR